MRFTSENVQQFLQTQAVDVSGAFENCFFHCYGAFLLANGLPLPADLFTFKSILEPDSPAKELQKLFPDAASLDFFAAYAKVSDKNQTTFPNFMVEKTLVLGILLREWFATETAKLFEHSSEAPPVILNAFKAYIDARKEGIQPEDLLSGPEGVLCQANQDFLESCVIRAAKEEINDACLHAHWANNGRVAYAKEIGKLNTKLAPDDLLPVLRRLNYSFRIYNLSGILVEHINPEQDDSVPFEVILDSAVGHYYLIKDSKTEKLLSEYQHSYDQYLKNRTAVLSQEMKLEDALPYSLLLPAICPKGLLDEQASPFPLFLQQMENMKKFIQGNDAREQQDMIQNQQASNETIPMETAEQSSLQGGGIQESDEFKEQQPPISPPANTDPISTPNNANDSEIILPATPTLTSPETEEKSSHRNNYSFLLGAFCVLSGVCSIIAFAVAITALVMLLSTPAAPVAALGITAGAGLAAGLVTLGLFHLTSEIADERENQAKLEFK